MIMIMVEEIPKCYVEWIMFITVIHYDNIVYGFSETIIKKLGE